MVRSFDVPCVNGPYVFPVPKNFPDLVRLATSSRGYFSSVIRRYCIFADHVVRYYSAACNVLSDWIQVKISSAKLR